MTEQSRVELPADLEGDDDDDVTAQTQVCMRVFD